MGPLLLLLWLFVFCFFDRGVAPLAGSLVAAVVVVVDRIDALGSPPLPLLAFFEVGVALVGFAAAPASASGTALPAFAAATLRR